MHTTSHIITRSIATALVAGAAMAPVAAAQSQDLRMPDTRDAAAPAERKQDLRMPDTRDRAEGRIAPVVEFVEVQRPDGFDFGDAIVGAGGAIGVVLVAAGSAIVGVRLRRRAHVQPAG